MNADIPLCPYFLPGVNFSWPSIIIQILISITGSILITTSLNKKFEDNATIVGVIASCAYGGFIGLMFQAFGGRVLGACEPGQASALIWMGKITINLLTAAGIGVFGSFASIFVFFVAAKSSEEKFDYFMNGIMAIIGIIAAFVVAYSSQ